MREIKFRTLYKNKWYYFTLDEVFRINQESMTDDDYGCISGENRTQFTGLKDDAGNDVYEGDILAHKEQSSLFKWQVIFKDGCFGISNICDSPIPDFHPCKGVYYFNDRIVIGNIYSNPELLNN